MYQDLSFMRIPLPEDVLKLKSFGDFEGAQKMIQHFLSKIFHSRFENAWKLKKILSG